MEVTEKERRVLRELQNDSDRSRKNMAAQTGMSESDFSRTVSSLVATGVIKRFTVDIDYAKLGFPDTGIFMFSLKDRNDADRIARELVSVPEILEIQEVFSEDHDIIVKIMGSDNRHIRSTCRKISEMDGIKNDAKTFTIIFAGTFKNERGIPV